MLILMYENNYIHVRYIPIYTVYILDVVNMLQIRIRRGPNNCRIRILNIDPGPDLSPDSTENKKKSS